MTLTELINELNYHNDRFSKDKIEIMVPVDGQPGRYKIYNVESVGSAPGYGASVYLAPK